MESIYRKIKTNLDELKVKNHSVLAALSGGVDSMTLLNILLELKDEYNLKISAAYINHNLRGKESDREEKFIREYLKKRSLRFFIKSIDKSYWDNLKSESIEMAARNVRYLFFNETALKNNIDFIATAHNLNDRIETYFLQLFRAGGIDTLRSIPIKNKNIIRPLLTVSRDEIEKYIYNKNIEFIEDSSNKKNIFKRNIIRNKLLPIFREIHPDYEKSFLHVFSFMKEEENFIKHITLKCYHKLKISESNNNIALNINKYKNLPAVIQKNLIKLILKKIKLPSLLNIALLRELSGSKERYIYKKSNFYSISKSHLIWFLNKSDNPLIKKEILINKIPFSFNEEQFEIDVRTDESADPRNYFTIKYDESLLPIKIRMMKKSDTINIINKSKNKNGIKNISITKILKSNSIPKIIHDQTIVIESANKEILGFVNNHICRVSNNFYINNQSDKKIIFIFNNKQ